MLRNLQYGEKINISGEFPWGGLCHIGLKP